MNTFNFYLFSLKYCFGSYKKKKKNTIDVTVYYNCLLIFQIFYHIFVKRNVSENLFYLFFIKIVRGLPNRYI